MWIQKNNTTVHQVCRIAQEVAQGFTGNKKTLMMLLGIEKAFDKIWRNGLIYKLSKLKIPNKSQK